MIAARDRVARARGPEHDGRQLAHARLVASGRARRRWVTSSGRSRPKWAGHQALEARPRAAAVARPDRGAEPGHARRPSPPPQSPEMGAERGEPGRPPVRRDAGGVDPGAADDPDPPAAIRAGPDRRERVVDDEGRRRRGRRRAIGAPRAGGRRPGVSAPARAQDAERGARLAPGRGRRPADRRRPRARPDRRPRPPARPAGARSSARRPAPAAARPRPTSATSVLELPPSTARTATGGRSPSLTPRSGAAGTSSSASTRHERRAGGRAAARRSPGPPPASASASAWSSTTAPSPCASTPSTTSRSIAAPSRSGSQSCPADVPADVAVAGGRDRRERPADRPGPAAERAAEPRPRVDAGRLADHACPPRRCPRRARRRSAAASGHGSASGCRRDARRRRWRRAVSGYASAQRPWMKNVARTSAAASASRSRLRRCPARSGGRMLGVERQRDAERARLTSRRR